MSNLTGCSPEHPFTKALYSEIAKHVKSILKKHEEEMGHRSREIENEQTKKRHQKLASEVSKFLKEHIEDLESHEDENYLVSADIPAGGMRIVPEGLKVPINKTKKVYIYVKPMAQQEDKHVLISSESSSIKVNSDIVELIARGDGILTNSISLTGLQVATDIKVKLVWNNVVKKFISVSVVLEKQQALSPLSEFQFEKQNYTVREGKEKKITILAQWPEFIHGKVILKVTMTQNEHCKLIHDTIALDYDRTSSEKYGKKFATGVVKVKGMKAGGPVLISAILQNKEIVAKIRVTKEFGQKYKIELIDEEEYGTEQRAFLLENVIKINGRHKIIQRYLGQREKWDDTQNSMHVRLLIAELVADIVARKILESKSQKNSNEYSDMDVTGFYKKHRQYVEKFLEIAHYIQIPNHEISQSL